MIQINEDFVIEALASLLNVNAEIIRKKLKEMQAEQKEDPEEDGKGK